jgi:hypothetical protein
MEDLGRWIKLQLKVLKPKIGSRTRGLVKIGDSILVLKLVFVVTDFDVNFQIQSINEGAIGGLTPVVKEDLP